MSGLLQHGDISFWSPSPERRNFGDYISEYLLREALIAPRVRAARHVLLGSVIAKGNIERELETLPAEGKIAFWGCGARDADPLPPEVLERCDFFGVRGPLTREVLGLSAGTPLGDPALIVPLLRPKASGRKRHGQTLCVPHFYETKTDAELVESTGADRVVRVGMAPRIENLEAVIDQISGAGFVLAGALHAAIVAYAYGVPFAFFDYGFVDAPFKWRDFAASIGAPTLFVADLDAGRRAWDDLIAPRARPLPLTPLLAVCPWFVKPSVLVKAAAHDAGLELDPRLVSTLTNSGVESPEWAAAAAASGRARDAQLREFTDALQTEAAAAKAQLVEAETRQAQLEADIAELSADLGDALEQRADAERSTGRWMADIDLLLFERRERLREIQRLEQAVAQGREAEAQLASIEARRAELETRLEAAEAALGPLRAELAAAQEALAEATERQTGATREEAERLTAELGAATARAGVAAEQLAEAQRRAELLERRWRVAAEGAEEAEQRAADAEAAVAAADKEVDAALKLKALFESRAAEREARLAAVETAAEEARAAQRRAAAERDAAQRRAEAAETALVGQGAQAARRAQAGLAPRAAGSRLSPLRPVTLWRARALARRGDWRGAASAYARLAVAAPQDRSLLIQYGHALKETERLDAAAGAYEAAMQVGGLDEDLAEHLGFTLRALGEEAAAERISIAADARLAYPPASGAGPSPGPARTRRSAGRLAAQAREAAARRDWPQASLRWEAAVRAAPGDAAWRVQLGHALKEAGRPRRALEAYLAALALAPDAADTHLQIGHALKILGRRGEAASAYRKAAQLDPDLADARAELAALADSAAADPG